MPSAAVYSAFKARLAANWTATPIITEPLAEAPTNENAFLVFQFPVSNTEKPVLERHYAEEGAARLILNVKTSIGVEQGLAWADTLSALFRTIKFSGVECFEPTAPSIDDANDDGVWFEFSIVVPYRYQFAG